MNPIANIGRYQIPILSVIGVKKRTGAKYWLQSLCLFVMRLIVATVRREPRPAWPDSGYDAMFANGALCHFTAEEKRLFDEAIEEHEAVMHIYGVCRSAGLRD